MRKVFRMRCRATSRGVRAAAGVLDGAGVLGDAGVLGGLSAARGAARSFRDSTQSRLSRRSSRSRDLVFAKRSSSAEICTIGRDARGSTRAARAHQKVRVEPAVAEYIVRLVASIRSNARPRDSRSRASLGARYQIALRRCAERDHHRGDAGEYSGAAIGCGKS